jgi:(R,R)-butanediol dehydrogenase/meso-butanediol dehydrogenase/diacetyl reductase
MKAAVFRHKSRSLEIARVPDPTPGEGQVVVKVGRCGICGSDLHMAAGHTYSFEEGAIPGHEFAGEIVALGRGATGVAIGDRVAVLPFISCGRCRACLSGEPGGCAKNRIMGSFGVQGGYAEYVLADALWCVRLPASLGLDDGALVEPLAVSLRANRVSGIKGGDRVLVIGAGAIGIAAAYWARRSGAARIAVAATSNRREAIARAVGADAFITPESDRKIAEQSRAALGGEADIVFECAGVTGSLDMAVSAVKRGGMISAPGFCWTPDTFTPVVAMIKEVTLKFTNVYDVREYQIAIGALERGHVEPRAMVTDVVGLDATPAAFAGLMSRNHQCKVLINPWG